MAAWIRSIIDVVLLRRAAYVDFGSRRDAVWRGFLLIVVVALLTGLPALVLDTVDRARAATSLAEPGDVGIEVDQVIDRLAPILDTLPAAQSEQIVSDFRAGVVLVVEAIAEIGRLPTPLPRPLGDILAVLGGWMSRPLRDSAFPLGGAVLATWLGYGVWVMLMARLMGGTGSLVRFFGTTALFALPHALAIFARVPYAGIWLGLLGFLWGCIIYVKATATSHEISVERALLAVLLPALLAAIVLAAAIIGFIGFIISVSNG